MDNNTYQYELLKSIENIANKLDPDAPKSEKETFQYRMLEAVEKIAEASKPIPEPVEIPKLYRHNAYVEVADSDKRIMFTISFVSQNSSLLTSDNLVSRLREEFKYPTPIQATGFAYKREGDSNTEPRIIQAIRMANSGSGINSVQAFVAAFDGTIYAAFLGTIYDLSPNNITDIQSTVTELN